MSDGAFFPWISPLFSFVGFQDQLQNLCASCRLLPGFCTQFPSVHPSETLHSCGYNSSPLTRALYYTLNAGRFAGFAFASVGSEFVLDFFSLLSSEWCVFLTGKQIFICRTGARGFLRSLKTGADGEFSSLENVNVCTVLNHNAESGVVTVCNLQSEDHPRCLNCTCGLVPSARLIFVTFIFLVAFTQKSLSSVNV